MKVSRFIPAVVASLLLTFASTASATTLEVKGGRQTGGVSVEASLKASSALLSTTEGWAINTCTISAMAGTSSVSTGTRVSIPLSLLFFSGCSEGNPVVDLRGTLTVENVGFSTNGTVRLINTRLTVPSSFGNLICTTLELTPGTDIGALTGVASGQATLDINAVLNCGFFSAKWQATYTVTSPEGLGVTT